MSRAEIWAQFAAAVATAEWTGKLTAKFDAAAAADNLMEEFDKRFVWHESPTGGMWAKAKPHDS